MPCVGLIVLGGCLTFIVAPDEQPYFRSEPALVSAFPTVVLDAGHGGNDDGAHGNGLVEKDLTLDVVQRTDALLKQFGFKTLLTRTYDTYVSLPERAAIGNSLDNAIFVSIHFNHARGSGSSAMGVETFYASQKVPPEAAWTWVGIFNKPEPAPTDNGETLAAFIQSSLSTRTEATNRGISGRPLYVVRHTRCPAALVECGFISNPFEARLIANPEYRDRVAKAIGEGIMGYTRSLRHPAKAPALAQR
ncbi:MAG: N-acetylmuramoyl-L-alanine amidase [Chthoniobacter sp.]|jgi:N-acetylmuramoyl-L-alanine amidase|nr:N-acetylmuramoyl-L-alanine amidase [Chthoniobacter sp.]